MRELALPLMGETLSTGGGGALGRAGGAAQYSLSRRVGLGASGVVTTSDKKRVPEAV